MTPQEFKAWFEGFTEAFDRLPSKAQWARIKERVAEIDGRPVTEHVYIDRYWRYPYPLWTTLNSPLNTSRSTTIGYPTHGTTFNSTAAMYAAGKNDAYALTNGET